MSTSLTYDGYDLYLSYVYGVLLFAIAQQSNAVSNILNVTHTPSTYILLYKPTVLLKHINTTKTHPVVSQQCMLYTLLYTIQNRHYVIEVPYLKKVRRRRNPTIHVIYYGTWGSYPYMVGHYT